MDRRIFLKGALGGGALGMVPSGASAALAARVGGDGRPMVVVAQADLPQAMALAEGIAKDLGVRVLAADDRQLGSFAGVSAMLDGAGGARVIGVMDDASALIFQQIAAARGAGLAMDAHRRVGRVSLVSFAIDS